MATQGPGPLKALMERFGEHNFQNPEIQRLVENWDILRLIGQGKISRKVLTDTLFYVVNPFQDEKVPFNTSGISGWEAERISTQLDTLQEFYSYLDASHVQNLAGQIELPEGADGVFVIPKLSRVAERFNITDPFVSGYGRLLKQSVLNYLEISKGISSEPLSLTAGEVQMRESASSEIQKLEETTPGDFLVIAAQAGRKYIGFSPRNARWEIEHSETEFPMPAWVAAHLVLANPKRLAGRMQVELDCVGDDYAPKLTGKYEQCLYFNGLENSIWFSQAVMQNAFALESADPACTGSIFKS